MVVCIFTHPTKVIRIFINIIGTISALILLFATPKAFAYFPSDFTNLLEGNVYTIRQPSRLRTPVFNASSSGYRSQRGRVRPKSLRVYSTNTYVKTVKKERVISRNKWLDSRSNQVMDICQEKFPENSIRCFARNHRLTQRKEIPVTHSNVR